MWSLELEAGQCLCCGICVDVCVPRALALRTTRTRGVDGTRQAKEGFPCLADAGACDGCLACVDQCPVAVIRIAKGSRPDRAPAEGDTPIPGSGATA